MPDPPPGRHVIAFLSWARQQRIICDVDVPVINTEGAGACPPGPDARLAAIRRLLLDDTLARGDRIAGCLVALYGQQVSTIAALRTTDTSCAAGATRLKLSADWLDVPEPVATPLREHLRNRSNTTTAANPASSWLFPGQLAGEHRSYRRLVRVLHQLGIPARASRLAAWRELVRSASPAVLADALGVSPGNSDAPRAPRRRRLVRLRRSKTCSHPGRQDVVVGHRYGVSPSALERACNIRRSDRPGTRRQRCSAWAFGSDPSLPPAITQAQDAMSIEGPAPRSPLIDRALSVGRVP